MFLLYLDESGVPETHPDQTSHFVVVGVAVHESTWYALESRVAGVRNRFGLDVGTELHAKWILRPYREQASIPGFQNLGWNARRQAMTAALKEKLESCTSTKRGRKANEHRHILPFVHLTRTERNELVAAALQVVGSYRPHKLYLFAEAINKNSLGRSIDPLEECFDHIVTRFERFLRERRHDHRGLLVVDHSNTQAQRLPELVRSYQRSGTRWTKIERVIEAPFFVDSSTCSGVQLADLCGYALRRCLEKGEVERLETVLGRFYRRSGALVGARHFTPRGCSCPICQERGWNQPAT